MKQKLCCLLLCSTKTAFATFARALDEIMKLCKHSDGAVVILRSKQHLIGACKNNVYYINIHGLGDFIQQIPPLSCEVFELGGL